MAAVESTSTKLLLELATRSIFLVVIESFIAIVATALSIVGNTFVLLALYRNPRLRKSSYMYIVSLAVSDVIISSVGLSLVCISVAVGRWCFGETVCWLQAFLVTMLRFTSLQNMSLIAVDRFLKVVHPNQHRKFISVGTILTAIFVVWFVTGTIPLSIYLSGSNAEFHPGHLACLFDLGKIRKVHLASIAVLGAFIPYQAMLNCYFRIWRFIGRHNNQMNMSPANVEEVKLTRLFVSIVGGFTLCFIPATLVMFIDALYKRFSLPREVYYCGTILIALGSCINPVIYGTLNSDFGQEFIRILGKEKRARIVPAANERQQQNL